MYDNDLVMKMHGSTTTCEYIRRFVRLVGMDKSALRVDTSRQYWTFLLDVVSCSLSPYVVISKATEVRNLQYVGVFLFFFWRSSATVYAFSR